MKTKDTINNIKTKKIVLTGPESVGKTTLTKYLSEYYKVPCIYEIARTYLNNNGIHYTQKDVLQIAKLQIKQEKELLKSKHNLIFIDTDLINIKIWLQVVYNNCPNWIDDYLKNYPASLHLLLYYDLPWEYDPLRENPNKRAELFEMYLTEIQQYKMPYVVIKGNFQQRNLMAVEAVEKIIHQYFS